MESVSWSSKSTKTTMQKKLWKEGFGLRTVHQRIQILFGMEYGLTLESDPDAGTKIYVRIPMQTNEKEMGA